MEDQNKKLDHRLNHLPEAKGNVYEALAIIEELQRLSYNSTAGEDGFTLSDIRSLLDKAAVYLCGARSAIARQMARQMALDDEEG